MKNIDYKEFHKRVTEVAKASRIFAPLTNNITEAFMLYQQVLAEEQMEIFVSKATASSRPLTPVDDWNRPKCPECETPLRLKFNAADMDGNIWPTAWVCEKCLAEYYSEKTVEQWKEELTANVHNQK